MSINEISIDRLVPLKGGVNFRDLGGYPTRHGDRVRWKKLFRSGHLENLTGDDLLKLEAYGISQVHDFRKTEEQQRSPSRVWNATFINDYNMAIGSLVEFWDHLYQDKLTPEVAHQLVVDSYGQCIDDVAEHYRRLLLSLLDNAAQASLFHCAAGKDRTGIAAALILSLLDVPRDAIMADYLLTQEHFDSDVLIKKVEGHLRAANVSEWDRGWLVPFCSVHEDNMDAFFAAVESRYGDVDTYLKERLGIDGDLKQRFHSAFLES